MNPITQDNLYLLLPSKVARVADMLVEDTGMSVEDAVCQIYDSEMYRQLEQEHTKLWHEGPVALYQRLHSQPAYNKRGGTKPAH